MASYKFSYNLVSISFFLLVVLFHGVLARQPLSFQGQHKCQLNNLNALEPTNRVEYEGGFVEFWDNNAQELQCADVSVFRVTIREKGLFLPTYYNTPKAFFVEQGSGFLGTVFPGCPPTYQTRVFSQSQQQSQQSQQQSQESHQQEKSFVDHHQKVEELREGDFVALPTGVAHWGYNEGPNPLVVVGIPDTRNVNHPREFTLAGNERQNEQGQSQEGESQGQGQKSHGQSEEGQESHHEERSHKQNSASNVLSGFTARIIAQSFNINPKTAQKLQNINDKRGNIVKVQGKLQFAKPPRRIVYQHQKQVQGQQQTEQQTQEGQQGGQDNGIEETLCTIRIRENLDYPDRADVFVSNAGRLATSNSRTLPVLNQLELSAVRGVLYPNGIILPHWNLNAHTILFVTNGQARIQVVNDNGQTVFDDNVHKKQLLVVPQGFAVVKQADPRIGFEWIAFKTNNDALIQTLAGKTSVIRGLPEQVIANAYEVPINVAKQIKYNNDDTILTSGNARSRADA